MEGRSSGAPSDACGYVTDIVPNHISPPSTNPIPYFVNLREFSSSKYNPNQTYTSEW